jgi:regulator of protease activity HflC (stomatin/prohibitin superfamily)
MGVKRLDMRIQKSEYDTNSSSKDMQTVQTKFAINWRIDGTKVAHVYRTIGNEDDILSNIIDPALSETLKAAMAKKTAEEVLTKREELKDEIDEVIKKKMLAYGVVVESINITNVEFSHDFAAAIEAKQVAEQKAQQAVYEAQQATQTANAERNRAKGQADAQTLLKTTLTPELLKMKAIEKWDGKFPQYMSGSLPFLSIKAND